MNLKPYYHLTIALVLSGLMLSGCSEEEAKALKNTAELFKSESIAAIDATETLILREVQEPQQTDEEAKTAFLKIILRQELADMDLTTNLDRLLNPPQPSATELEHLKTYLASLKEQYGTLASVYDDLERGYILANGAIQKTKPPLEKLTVQMAYLATCMDEHPAYLVRDRDKVLANIVRLRRAYFKASDSTVRKDIESNILDQFTQWQKISKEEKDLTQNILNHSIKAAIIGRELRKRIDGFNNIKLGNLNSLLSNMLDVVSTINGERYDGLKKRANQLYTIINNDEDLRDATEIVIGQINSSSNPARTKPVLVADTCSALMQAKYPPSNSNSLRSPDK